MSLQQVMRHGHARHPYRYKYAGHGVRVVLAWDTTSARSCWMPGSWNLSTYGHMILVESIGESLRSAAIRHYVGGRGERRHAPPPKSQRAASMPRTPPPQASSASNTRGRSWASNRLPSDHPTTFREYRSSNTAKYNQPSWVQMSLKSPTQIAFGLANVGSGGREGRPSRPTHRAYGTVHDGSCGPLHGPVLIEKAPKSLRG